MRVLPVFRLEIKVFVCSVAYFYYKKYLSDSALMHVILWDTETFNMEQ